MNTETTNTPEQHNVLIDSIGKYLVGMIEGIVERKVNQIFQSHATMALIDEKTKDLLRDIAADLITEHEQDFEHHSTDDISDTVATHIAHYNFDDQIRRSVEEILSDGDYCTEERATELAGDACADIDFEEKVKEVLRNI